MRVVRRLRGVSLLARFGVISLLLTVVVGLVLSSVLSRAIEDRARQQASFLVDQAVEHLSDHGAEADLLRAIARFAIERDH